MRTSYDTVCNEMARALDNMNAEFCSLLERQIDIIGKKVIGEKKREKIDFLKGYIDESRRITATDDVRETPLAVKAYRDFISSIVTNDNFDEWDSPPPFVAACAIEPHIQKLYGVTHVAKAHPDDAFRRIKKIAAGSYIN